MSVNRAWLFVCLLALSCAGLVGCSQTPGVPDDARLVYYGLIDNSSQISTVLPNDPDDPARQVYVYDETLGKLAAVRTVDGRHRDLNLSWTPGHKYRVYTY